MKVKELIALLEKEDQEMEVVIDMTPDNADGFYLCPVAQVDQVVTSMDESFVMLTGLQYQATTTIGQN